MRYRTVLNKSLFIVLMILLLLSSWQSATGTTSLPVNQSVGLEVTPIYQGKFTVNGEAFFSLSIKNIGSQTDQFNIALPSNPWTFDVYDSYHNRLLDTDGDGNPNTSDIGAGFSADISIKTVAPTGSDIGAYTMEDVTVTSRNDGSQTQIVKLQAAVPTAFGQAVKSSETGVDLFLIWPNSQRKITLSKLFTGSSLAAATLLDNGYMYVWERTDLTGSYQNLEFSLVSRAGMVIQGETDLTNNQGDSTQTVYDRAPSLTVNSKNGLVGIVWKREIFKGDPVQLLSNIYLMIFNPATQQKQILSITKNNDDWWVSGSSIPRYDRPIIKSIGDQFFITWEERSLDNVTNIILAAYSSDGIESLPSKPITDSLTDQVRYEEPGIAVLNGDRILITYTKYNNVNDINDSNPSYQVIDMNGDNIDLGGAKSKSIPVPGKLVTAAELGNRDILMAWTQMVNDSSFHGKQIRFILLDDMSYQPINANPTPLPTLDGRESDLVSASIDGKGYGILTWLDYSHKQQLYYALINQDGTYRTPVMAFNKGGENPGLLVNGSGYSLASYMGSWITYLPLTVKK
jgi:hypothetical protein